MSEETKNSEHYSVADATRHAKRYCEDNPGWTPIWEIPNTDDLYKKWEELPKSHQRFWLKKYGEVGAKGAWEEMGHSVCKVPYGFISGEGSFYKEITDVPLFHNSVMIFKTA